MSNTMNTSLGMGGVQDAMVMLLLFYTLPGNTAKYRNGQKLYKNSIQKGGAQTNRIILYSYL